MRKGARSSKAAALFLLASLPFLAPAPGAADSAGPFSAADLRGMCTSSIDVDYGYCAGYVTAVSHALLGQSVAGMRACNHAQVRSQQLVDTFNTWADLFPESLGLDAETAVATALSRAFPCR